MGRPSRRGRIRQAISSPEGSRSGSPFPAVLPPAGKRGRGLPRPVPAASSKIAPSKKPHPGFASLSPDESAGSVASSDGEPAMAAAAELAADALPVAASQAGPCPRTSRRDKRGRWVTEKGGSWATRTCPHIDSDVALLDVAMPSGEADNICDSFPFRRLPWSAAGCHATCACVHWVAVRSAFSRVGFGICAVSSDGQLVPICVLPVWGSSSPCMRHVLMPVL